MNGEIIIIEIHSHALIQTGFKLLLTRNGSSFPKYSFLSNVCATKGKKSINQASREEQQVAGVVKKNSLSSRLRNDISLHIRAIFVSFSGSPSTASLAFFVFLWKLHLLGFALILSMGSSFL